MRCPWLRHTAGGVILAISPTEGCGVELPLARHGQKRVASVYAMDHMSSLQRDDEHEMCPALFTGDSNPAAAAAKTWLAAPRVPDLAAAG